MALISEIAANEPVAAPRTVRLDTLIRLRWLAIGGQVAAVIFVDRALGFELPVVTCAILIALSAALNLFVQVRYPANLRIDEWPAFSLLAFDVLQLGGLLYLTGGLQNPFALLLLVPVIVSATTLPPLPTFLLGIAVAVSASSLFLGHMMLPWKPGGILPVPIEYEIGVWIALNSAAAFTGAYAFRVAEEARQLARALSATELALAHEQHLSALDGLAAAAAHELGTPLATISLVAKEMQREFPPGSPQGEDVALLTSQAQRCRDILARLTSLPDQTDQHFGRLPLSHLIEEVIEPYRAFGAALVVEPAKGVRPEPIGRRDPAVIQGLANLVENAVDFAENRVTVTTEWNDHDVTITIADDGQGFAPGIIDRIGEPYVTTRGGPTTGQAAGGLGLGFFISKTLLGRSGATVHLENRAAPDHGAVVRISWPRAAMERGVVAPVVAAPVQRRLMGADKPAWRRALEFLHP
jgi:two-component system sensor histidine kinase RegB